MNERNEPQDAIAHFAKLGRGEVESYRRALQLRGVNAFVLPLRECDGAT